jgi:hypothetical protein
MASETSLEARLRDVRRSGTDLATRRRAFDALLRDVLAHPRATTLPDAAARRSIADLAASLGWAPPDLDGLQLRPGETYLLLAHPRGLACTLRVTAREGQGASDDWIDDRIERREVLGRARVALATVAIPMHHTVPVDRGFDLTLHAPGVQRVQGSSLDTAVALALLSALVDMPLPRDLAATAGLGSDGRLRAVEGLAEKLAALRASFPEVRRVLVSSDQPAPDGPPEGIDLVRCGTFAEVLAKAGLTGAVYRLPHATLGELRAQAASLLEVKVGLTNAEWARHSDECARLASLLTTLDDPDCATLRLQMLVHALQCAVHATDPGRMACREKDLVEAIPEERIFQAPADDALPLHVLVSAAIVLATRAIDESDWQRARRAASRAVEFAAALDPERARHLRGRAVGTLGRVLLHAGDPGGAIEPLREAHAWHCARLRREAPRSACYLAQALRLDGRVPEARALLERTVEELDAPGAVALHDETPITRRYLELELGRCALAEGRGDHARLTEARLRLQRVEDAQPSPTDYPRLGAARSLLECAALRRDADEFERRVACLRALFEDERVALPDRELAAVALLRAHHTWPEARSSLPDASALRDFLVRHAHCDDADRFAARYVY